MRFFVTGLLITPIALMISSQLVWAGEKIINAEFHCMPYKGGSLRSYSNLTEQPFRLIEPKEIFVVVDGDQVRVKHLSFWETLQRDHSDAPWVAASTDNLFTQQ